MGAGVTYLLMPQLYSAFALALPLHSAWRVAFVVPAVICVIVGLLDYFIVDDCPGGDWLKLRNAALSEKADPIVPVINEVVNVQSDSEKAKNASNSTPAGAVSPQASIIQNHKEDGFLDVMGNFIHVFK